MADRRQVYVLVRGRVQGVGFRYHTLSQANGLQLAGWVRNRSDGAVEVVVEGPADAVERMLEWLRRGPSSASVSDARVQDRTPSGLQGFQVRY